MNSKLNPIEVKKFFGRFVAFAIISVSIVAGAVLIANFHPPDVVYPDDAFEWEYSPPEGAGFNVLLDQHSHTYFSDGVLSPEQNIQWHLANGFNAMVLTDHNTILGAIEAQKIARNKYNDSIKVIIGEEWTTSRIHMNLIGIETLVPIPVGPVTDASIQAAINATHAQGGFVTVNHIPWSLRQGMDHPNRSQLLSWGVDFVELVNGDEYDNESATFFHGTTVGNITGTDMHSPGPVYCWTGLNAPTFTEDGILAALATKNTTVIYNQTGSPDHSKAPVKNPAYVALEPIIIIGQGIEDLYWAGETAMILAMVYLFASFFVAEGLRVVKRRYWKNMNEKRQH